MFSFVCTIKIEEIYNIMNVIIVLLLFINLNITNYKIKNKFEEFEIKKFIMIKLFTIYKILIF